MIKNLTIKIFNVLQIHKKTIKNYNYLERTFQNKHFQTYLIK